MSDILCCFAAHSTTMICVFVGQRRERITDAQCNIDTRINDHWDMTQCNAE